MWWTNGCFLPMLPQHTLTGADLAGGDLGRKKSGSSRCQLTVALSIIPGSAYFHLT